MFFSFERKTGVAQTLELSSESHVRNLKQALESLEPFVSEQIGIISGEGLKFKFNCDFRQYFETKDMQPESYSRILWNLDKSSWSIQRFPEYLVYFLKFGTLGQGIHLILCPPGISFHDYRWLRVEIIFHVDIPANSIVKSN